MVEVTRKYAKQYVTASKKDKGRMLDEFCELTGLSRSRARHALVETGRRAPNVVRMDRRQRRDRKYSTDAREVLKHLWVLSGGSCGPYLAAQMGLLLDSMEAHGELVDGRCHYTPSVRTELESMSGATIDRYLQPIKATASLRGFSTTKPDPLLRSSITIRRAGDEAPAEPGFVEVDTVAHCGPTLKGEFARSVSFTDMITGWTVVIPARNNARKWILQALDQAVEQFPFPLLDLDCDNGSEFINHEVNRWVCDRDIFFTRSRPYRKNDQATIESKNNHVVRKHGFYYRYDTPRELALLGTLWTAVGARTNYFTPTRKPVGWGSDCHGHRTRRYDAPSTPLDRLLAAEVLSRAQAAELLAQRDRLNPAELTRDILRAQNLLIDAAKTKTDALYAQVLAPKTHPAALRHRPA